jgi:hypothetical protein
MRLYYSGGFVEHTLEDLYEKAKLQRMHVGYGTITDISILERKTLSNKGNALSAWIKEANSDFYFGLNIGGNPIGTGYKTYIPFLEDMHCEKIGPLFRVKSLIGRNVAFFGNDFIKGFAAPQKFIEGFYR